ncbi:hypothetical protein [Tuberibacillus sp. Marseille-P3662]|nr:hypothetical protein [Tuberibacillus sp. Marseille-P3662]
MNKMLKISIIASLMFGGVTTFIFKHQDIGPPSGAPDPDTEVVKTL